MKMLQSTRRRVAAFVRASPSLYDFARQNRLRWLGPNSVIGEHLDRLSKSRLPGFTFMQIGANDGLRNDPVRDFVVRDSWPGVFVEPLPDVFLLLQQNYKRYTRNGRLQFLNVAVSSHSKVLPFYTFSESFLEGKTREERLHYLRKASFNPNQVRPFAGSDENVREIEVPCVGICELLSRYCPEGRLGLLALDVEGHEPEILREIDFVAFKIGAILFETWNLGAKKDEVFRLLQENGYRIDEAEGDALAVRQS